MTHGVMHYLFSENLTITELEQSFVQKCNDIAKVIILKTANLRLVQQTVTDDLQQEGRSCHCDKSQLFCCVQA